MFAGDSARPIASQLMAEQFWFAKT